MRLRELFESISKQVYHYTRLGAAADIIANGEFMLSSTVGSGYEKELNPDKYPYFLSTTRTKLGGYHRDPGPDAVMFVMDGDWYNRRYKGGPVDYWGDRQSNIKPSEAEDRIFSKEPSIPTGGVIAMHVYLNPDKSRSFTHTARLARKLLIDAKTKGIPVYLYNDSNAWIQQDTRKTVSIKDLEHILRAPNVPQKQYKGSFIYGSSLDKWLELLQAQASSQLSDKAKSLASSIAYNKYSSPKEDSGLGIDMSNARKPSSSDRSQMEKIVKLMRTLKLSTPAEVRAYVQKKWKDIFDAEYEAKYAGDD